MSSKTHKVETFVSMQKYKDGGCNITDIRSQILTQQLQQVDNITIVVIAFGANKIKSNRILKSN